MAGSVNKVILIGHLGKDPEVRSFASGGRVASFSLATSESWKDKATGERKERTEWHTVVVRNDALIGVVDKYLRKGSKLFVEGQLATRKWADRDGVERYTTEVVVGGYSGGIRLLDSAARDGAGRSAAAPASEPQPSPEDFDDDVPF